MKVAIIGIGGHSKVIRDIAAAIKGIEIAGFFDDKFTDDSVKQGIYYGPIFSALRLREQVRNLKFMIAIGDNRIRRVIVEKLKLSDEEYAVLIHPSAIISLSAKIGNGSVVMANAVVNADADIRKHTIINSSSVIEHDAKVGDYAHISPKATLTGGVTVEEGVHVGAGATLIPQVVVGKWSVIGAGATVIRDIPSDCTAVGTPAVIKQRNYQEVE
jgi:acetyltransferase EpsM